MDIEQAWKFVENSLSELEKQYEIIRSAARCIDLNPESPLTSPMYVVSEHLIKALEHLVDDKESTIDWYVHECDFGKKQMEAGYHTTEKEEMRKIATIKDLRWLVEVQY